MAENKINVNLDLPKDCVIVLKIFLDRAIQKGVFNLDDALVIGLALQNLQKSAASPYRSRSPRRSQSPHSMHSTHTDFSRHNDDGNN